MVLHKIKRPQAGGTAQGVRPRRYVYWRTGYGEERPLGNPFWIGQAGEYHCKPNYITGDFEHGYRSQFFYHLSGDATFSYSNRTETVKPGDLLTIPPKHTFEYKTNKGMRHHWFVIDGRWPLCLGDPAPTLTSLGYDQIFESLFIELREILILQQSGYMFQAIGIFYQLLARRSVLIGVARHHERNYPELVQNAVIYLRETYAQPFHAKDVAGAIGVSQTHLRTLFDQWLGEPPKRFHTRCRINQAKRLLKEQNLTVSEVAFHVGYPDAGHFSRVFKQFVGLAPSQYANI